VYVEGFIIDAGIDGVEEVDGKALEFAATNAVKAFDKWGKSKVNE